MSIVTYENVDTPVFELDTMRYLFRDGLQGMWIDFRQGYVFADTDLTTPANPGEGIAGYVDRGPYGYDGTQPVITARPILGRVPRTGRRNLLTWTEDFSNPAWWGSQTNGVQILPLIGGPPSGVGAGVKLAETSGIAHHRISWTTIGLGVGVLSVYAKAAERHLLRMWGFTQGNTLAALFNLNTGEVVAGSGYAEIEPAGDGWYRCSYIQDVAKSTTAFGPALSGNTAQYEGEDGYGVYIAGAQFDAGLVPTPYQRVGNEYDVTEAGVTSVYYAHYDGADDVLPSSLTIPSISEGCFILVGTNGIWIDNEWTNTFGTLSVGPTTYTGGPEGILPVVGNILSIIWREEPLTEAEKAEVVRYGVKRGSPGEI